MTITDSTPEVDTERVGYIIGLRQLADLLERHDDLALPYEGRGYARLGIFVETKDEVLAWVRAMDGPVSKQYDSDGSYDFRAEGALAGLNLRVYAPRGEVCERIVTGVETVTETVPDPEALAAVPTVEVTREVEQIEWRCHPLLADEATA
jgi:hypothetical protein